MKKAVSEIAIILLMLFSLTVISSSPSVNPSPTLTYSPTPFSIVLSPQHSTINIGQTVNFTATFKGGTPPYRCHWYMSFADFNRVGEEISTSQSFIFTPNSTGWYFFRFQGADSAGHSNSQFLIPMSINVTANSTLTSSPISTFTPSPSPTPFITPSYFPTQQPPTEQSPTPSPSIPELPSIVAVSVLMVTVLAGTIVYKKRTCSKV